jgi:hypothetical protein
VADKKVDKFAKDKDSAAGKIKQRRDDVQKRLDDIMKSMTTPDKRN